MKASASYERLHAVSSETVEKAKEIELMLREYCSSSEPPESDSIPPESTWPVIPTKH